MSDKEYPEITVQGDALEFAYSLRDWLYEDDKNWPELEGELNAFIDDYEELCKC